VTFFHIDEGPGGTVNVEGRRLGWRPGCGGRWNAPISSCWVVRETEVWGTWARCVYLCGQSRLRLAHDSWWAAIASFVL